MSFLNERDSVCVSWVWDERTVWKQHAHREIAQKAREMAKKEYDGGIILCILLE